MRAICFALSAVLSTGPARAAPEAAALVTFKDPRGYFDATFRQPRTEKNLAAVQDAVREMFSSLAGRYLAPGQSLAVEVTQIDLAGRFAPMSMNDIRIMDSVSWPRMTFTFAVRDGSGRAVAAGEADLSDRGYLDSFNRYFGGDRLRYEREMLSTWFRETFPQAN
jgi:hypothetical protein